MIYPSLNTLAEELNASIYEKWGATINGTAEIVQLNNIANIADEKSDLQNKIILTLIKVEEEPTLKNSAFYVRKSAQEWGKHHPAVYLNLYLLVSVTKKNYNESLQLLSDTITFFQAHKVFTGNVSNSGTDEEAKFKIMVELHDMNLQEVFEMWSNLGNKQFPSVIYKVRLLKLLDTQELEDAPAIQKVNRQTGDLQTT